MSVSMTISMVFSLVASLFVPKIAMKLGKKKSFVVALCLYAIGCLLIFLLGAKNWAFYTATGCLNAGAVYLFTGFGANYFIDCGEYYLHKTGTDTRDIAISMFSVPMKV